MKLSALKDLVSRIEANSKSHGIADPEISFWPTTDAEKAVKGLSPRGIFVDMEPESTTYLDTHRIVTQGRTFGDYSLPLILKVNQS